MLMQMLLLVYQLMTYSMVMLKAGELLFRIRTRNSLFLMKLKNPDVRTVKNYFSKEWILFFATTPSLLPIILTWSEIGVMPRMLPLLLVTRQLSTPLLLLLVAAAAIDAKYSHRRSASA
jgi:hypothetical protein